jgi:hypothetical protein
VRECLVHLRVHVMWAHGQVVCLRDFRSRFDPFRSAASVVSGDLTGDTAGNALADLAAAVGEAASRSLPSTAVGGARPAPNPSTVKLTALPAKSKGDAGPRDDKDKKKPAAGAGAGAGAGAATGSSASPAPHGAFVEPATSDERLARSMFRLGLHAHAQPPSPASVWSPPPPSLPPPSVSLSFVHGAAVAGSGSSSASPATSSGGAAPKAGSLAAAKPVFRTIALLLAHPIRAVRDRMRSGVKEVLSLQAELPK